MRKEKSFLSILLLAAAAVSIFFLNSPCWSQPVSSISVPVQDVAAPAQNAPLKSNQMDQPGDTNDFLLLVDLKVENYPDAARITLRTNRYFEYIDYNLEDSSGGIVFDPTGPLYVNLAKPEFARPGLISDVRFAKSAVREKEMPSILQQGFYPLDYFVIVVPPDTPYNISQRANLVVIDIGQTRLPKPEEFIPSFTVKKKIETPKVQQIPATEKFLKPQEVAEDFVKSNIPKAAKKAKPAEKAKTAKIIAQAPQPESLKAQPMKEMPQTIGITFKTLRDQILAKSMSMKSAMLDLPKGKNVFNYKDCMEIATVNCLPVLIAEEEVMLNDYKINEAKRGLYPTATAKYTTTDGKTTGVEFREESYGVQVEQPIYYGGRLKLTLKQAQVNRQVANTKYDKAEADLVSKITESFYGMATAQLNIQDQQQLIKESKIILELARQKREAELTNQLEFLNVQSQCNQIEYQISVAAKDLEIARINLLQAMGVDPSPEIFVDFSLDYKEYDIDLNKCLLMAYQNRPELTMHELLQEASNYEEKIAKSKDDFKVDFTGFLGESGGAYKTEPLNLGSDWYVGFKASKPLIGNTGSYSYTDNKTSPKLGQSTRTQGASHSFEFGILNNLSGYSEKQSALIGRLKAENDLIEIEKTINLEVREAYNNYQKAVIQIKNTNDKIAFREEELKVLKAQAEVNEALLSQVLDAMVKLNDEKALSHQAIASYKTALANLNKAIGLVGCFE